MKIAVIGQGISGTSTALALLETFPGIRVTVFGDRPFEDIASFGPAGFFQINHPNHKKWGIVSWERFSQLDREYGPSIGVKYCSGEYQSDDKKELDDLKVLNGDVIHNFHWLTEKEKKERFVNPSLYCVHFSSYALEGRIYVPWLKQQCESHGAVYVTREIHSFDQLANDGYDIIMNCSGLHGGKIAGDDDTVYPLRGVAFEMDAPGFKHFSCHGIATFLLPLDKTVLIGTVRQKDRYDRTVTDEDRKEVLTKFYKVHPALKSHKIIREWCGLRPDRPSVRVERQTRTTSDGKIYDVVHNYGHGSNGFTLSWGTAQNAASFVKEILQEKGYFYSSKL